MFGRGSWVPTGLGFARVLAAQVGGDKRSDVSVRALLGGFDLGWYPHDARYPAASANLIQFWGNSSLMRLAGWLWVRTNASAR